MNSEAFPQREPSSNGAHQRVMLAEIEQIIDRIGTRYIDDLRTLSDEFGRLYEAQLTAKDQQIAELSQRLEVAEREHAELEAELHELKRISARYIDNLRGLSNELSRYMDRAED